ncbi:hypothetical protein [Nostoc sp. KVJ20]|uniref:hypothetical protein n=1 Tax=Nostoc sp. KVJ20 TaxID=457944 RepID=UPI00114D167C|nr:hypothetical protein [Nostoc sp. KVJ20]
MVRIRSVLRAVMGVYGIRHNHGNPYPAKVVTYGTATAARTTTAEAPIIFQPINSQLSLKD